MSGADRLTAAHRRMLEHDSAILPELLAEEDISSRASSLGLPTPDRALRHPNSHKGQRFGQWGDVDDRFRPIDLGPGIWFGTHDVHGRLSGQYRPDRPHTAYDGHQMKYVGCRGTRLSFAVPLRCRPQLVDSMCELFITEGYRKALALASAGGCAISLAGVDAWLVKPEPNAPSEPIDDFDAVRWHGRTVWIAYDSDAVEKDGVRWAERRLTAELERRGAIVMVLRIPHGPDGEKRGIDDYIRDRLAAGVSRADALGERKSVAMAELVRLSRVRRTPSTGGDGGATCDGHCPTSTALREEVREYKAADQLVRFGPFSPTTAQIVKHHIEQAAIIRRNGQPKGALERTKIAEATNTNERAVTRAWAEWEQLQADPEVKAKLPYLLARRASDDGKDHVDLVVPVVEERPQPADMLVAARQLPRLKPAHGGVRQPTKLPPDNPPCRKCGELMATHRTRQDVCPNDACDNVVTYPTRVMRPPYAGPIVMHGDVYEVAATPSQGEGGQDVPPSNGTKGGQDVSPLPIAPLIPVSMVRREDLELFDTANYSGEAPPEPPEPPPAWTPPPLAPSFHLARAFKRFPPTPRALKSRLRATPAEWERAEAQAQAIVEAIARGEQVVVRSKGVTP